MVGWTSGWAWDGFKEFLGWFAAHAGLLDCLLACLLACLEHKLLTSLCLPSRRRSVDGALDLSGACSCSFCIFTGEMNGSNSSSSGESA